MSQGHAFNSLGQIIAVGGELAVARLIDRGLRGAALNSAIGARFPGISPDARADVIDLARLMIASGQSLTGKSSVYDIDPSTFPTVEPLFRGWEGNVRAKVGIEVSFPGREETLRLIVGIDDITTFGAIENAAFDLLMNIIDNYEERVEHLNLRNVPKGSKLRIVFTEKAF